MTKSIDKKLKYCIVLNRGIFMAILLEIGRLIRVDRTSSLDREGKKRVLLRDIQGAKRIDRGAFNTFVERLIDLSTSNGQTQGTLREAAVYDGDVSIHLWQNGENPWISAVSDKREERIEFVRQERIFLGKPVSAGEIPCLTVAELRAAGGVTSALLDIFYPGRSFVNQEPLGTHHLKRALTKAVKLLDAPAPFQR